MKNRSDAGRYLTIFVLTASAAAIVWFVFHNVYFNLSEGEKAAGYVDPMTQTGIDLGYIAMVGGTAIFSVLALWAAFHVVREWLRNRRPS